MAMKVKTEPNLDDKQDNVTGHRLIFVFDGQKFNRDYQGQETILEILQSSHIFQGFLTKNTSKELVILKQGYALSQDLPCHLVENDTELTLKFIKPKGVKRQIGRQTSDQTVTFMVATRGEKNIRKLMHNPALKECVDSVLVFAYKGETVEEALKWDGRFDSDILQKNFGLFDIKSSIIMEKDNVVNSCCDKHYKIALIRLSSAMPGKINRVPNAALSGVNQEAQPSTGASAKTQTSKTNPKQNVVNISITVDSGSTYKHLCWQYGERDKKDAAVLRREYGKNRETCMEVNKVSSLVEYSESICQVQVNEDPKGTGFCLLNKYILTNAHVITPYYEDGKLYENTTVVFHSVKQKQPESTIKVKRVVAMEKSDRHDWALLELENGTSHDLFKCFTFTLADGGICLIGHPNGGVKKIDPCVIIPIHERSDNIEIKKQMENLFLFGQLFTNATQFLSKHKDLLTYDSCFYYGSSGSPVFNEHCRVVAMHTGGFVYEHKSVIEYAQPMSVIITRIFIQLTELERFDVLKEFLSWEFLTHSVEKHNKIKDDIKKLVERENIKLPEYTGEDETLKAFFCSEEPMEVN